MRYSLQIRVRIVVLMAKFESPRETRRALQRENTPDIPTEKAIKNIQDKFLETGSVQDRERSGRSSSMTEEKKQEIIEVLENTPMTTIQSVSQEVNISKLVVHRTMRYVLKYKPYKMHLTQEIYDEDKDLRVEMAELLIPIIDDQRHDGLLFFSDEATFHLSGVVNKHNCRIWAESNPFVTIDIARNSPKINVWCAMSSEEIVGPFFFEEDTVNQENYSNMLENYLYPILQRKRLTKRIFFQQDGAPAHFSKQVRAWLSQKFNNRWIGRGGPISWAPRSPDLTPLDFFLWGHVKTQVYKRKVANIDELKARIIEEIRAIGKETLHNVFSEVKKRLNFCIEVQGDTFEQYL